MGLELSDYFKAKHVDNDVVRLHKPWDATKLPKSICHKTLEGSFDHEERAQRGRRCVRLLYQAQYALVLLWHEVDDDAVVYLETLDPLDFARLKRR